MACCRQRVLMCNGATLTASLRLKDSWRKQLLEGSARASGFNLSSSCEINRATEVHHQERVDVYRGRTANLRRRYANEEVHFHRICLKPAVDIATCRAHDTSARKIAFPNQAHAIGTSLEEAVPSSIACSGSRIVTYEIMACRFTASIMGDFDCLDVAIRLIAHLRAIVRWR